MPIEPNLKNQLALVTGASIGIGAETAVALARAGARVIIHYNSSREGAEAVLTRVREAGSDGECIAADLSTAAGTQSLIDQVRQQPVDILINNAGSLIRRTRILEFTNELWEQAMMLNLTSAFLVTQALLPGMVQRKRGFVVNVGSVAGRNGGGLGAAAYATAKGAIAVLTKSLAKEFASQGVRVNCVAPGTIDTKFHQTFSTDAMLDAVRAATPLGRLGTSEEVADVILFLCSPGAEFIHGQTIEINGGFYMP